MTRTKKQKLSAPILLFFFFRFGVMRGSQKSIVVKKNEWRKSGHVRLGAVISAERENKRHRGCWLSFSSP